MISRPDDLGDKPLGTPGKHVGCKRDSERRYNVSLWRKYRSCNATRSGRKLFIVDTVPLPHNVVQLTTKPGPLPNSIPPKRPHPMHIQELSTLHRITLRQP